MECGGPVRGRVQMDLSCACFGAALRRKAGPGNTAFDRLRTHPSAKRLLPRRRVIGHLCRAVGVSFVLAAASWHSATARAEQLDVRLTWLLPIQTERRSAAVAAVLGLAGGLASPAQQASALFPNALPQARQTERQNAGLRPGDLGLEERRLNRKGDMTPGPALRGCKLRPSTCFSTTFDPRDKGVANKLEPWAIPEGTAPAAAVDQLTQVLLKYPVGQNGVDEGGYRLVEQKRNYVYLQFAAISGRVDDVEFAVQPDGKVLIHSESRATKNEFDVQENKPDGLSNAKRLNYISAELRKGGWTTAEITPETYSTYFKLNEDEAKKSG